MFLLCECAQLCPTLCDPMNCSPPGSSVHGSFPGKNTGVDCHFLLQGIFPTQGLNPHLLHLLHWQGRFFTTVSPGMFLLWKPIWKKKKIIHLNDLDKPQTSFHLEEILKKIILRRWRPYFHYSICPLTLHGEPSRACPKILPGRARFRTLRSCSQPHEARLQVTEAGKPQLGGSGPEWNLPTVRVSWMKPVRFHS